MKTRMLFALAGALFFGAVLGSFIGMPVVGALVFTSLAMFAEVPKGALSVDGIDVSLVRSQVEEYFKYYSKTVWTQILKGTDFEQYMRKIGGVRNKYVTSSAVRGEMLQPYQPGWTPKGGVEVKPYINDLFTIKSDLTFEEDKINELYTTYLANIMVDETKTPDNQPFVVWFVQNHLIPGWTEELRAMSVKGEFVAPTTGTPGASLESANGIFTIIRNEVAGGGITPLAIGEITSSNIVDKLELFHRSLPSEYKSLSGNIFMSTNMVEDYVTAYRDAFGRNQDYDGPTVKLYNTQKTLIGLDDLNGSDRVLYTPSGANGNLLVMFDKIINPAPSTDVDKRDLHVFTKFHRGWGFETLDAVFVNDSSED